MQCPSPTAEPRPDSRVPGTFSRGTDHGYQYMMRPGPCRVAQGGLCGAGQSHSGTCTLVRKHFQMGVPARSPGDIAPLLHLTQSRSYFSGVWKTLLGGQRRNGMNFGVSFQTKDSQYKRPYLLRVPSTGSSITQSWSNFPSHRKRCQDGQGSPSQAFA